MRYVSIRTHRDSGAIIRRARKAQGLTLTQVSGLSGLGVRFISELECGKSTIQLGKALEVVALLGLELQVTGLERDDAR